MLVPWAEFGRILHDGEPCGGTLCGGGRCVLDDGQGDIAALLASGPATWEDGTGPVPDRIIRSIAYDGEIRRIIFGPNSQVINVGRAARFFNCSQRRALVARDRRCSYPGCGAPVYMTDGHHTIGWLDGGETNLDHGALLCRRHHLFVDQAEISMAWDGQWRFTRPDGTEIVEPVTPWVQRR